jgi:hypothetical protein
MLQRVGPPLAAFVLARGLLAAAALSAGLNPLDPRIFVRWDSGHYLGIAEVGYDLEPCREDSGYANGLWCGNAGWFPGYPWAIRLMGLSGLRPQTAGALLSGLCSLACLTLLWNAFLGAAWNGPNALCLALAAFFPGQVYHHAVFPTSMLTLCALLALHFAGAGRPVAAGLAGAAAAATYPTGFLLAPVILVASLLGAAGPRGRSWRFAVSTSVLTALGLAAVPFAQWVALDDPKAFLKVQGKYGHGWNWPIATLRRHVKPLVDGEWRWTSDVPALQSALVALFMLAIAFRVIAAMRRGRAERQDVLLIAFALAFWLFPLVLGASVSACRAEALLLPSAALLRRLPAPAQAAVAAASAALAYPIALLFYYRVLV